MKLVPVLVRALVALPRRAGAYASGIVVGFPDERRYGNHPGYRREVRSGHGGLEGEAHLRAVSTAISAAGAGS